MSISNEDVQTLLEKGLPDSTITVNGDGYKYETTIISASFEGLNKVKRHQKVYGLVNDAITSGELHALTIIAMTPQEAEDKG